MLPKIDGWQVLAKRPQEQRKTPVLILTARDAIDDRVRGLDARRRRLPGQAVRAGRAVRPLAGLDSPRGRPGHGRDRRIGDVVVDTAQPHGHAAAAEPVGLTAREYALVELLALHRGEVVTRTQMYDHLFDENDDTLSNLVEVHVSNIRRKLGKDFIVTRRGLGYVVDG